MTSATISNAVAIAIQEQGVRREGGLITMSVCQFYGAVRNLMHRLDNESGRLDPRRYGYKAVAGAMTELIRRQCGS